MMFSLAAMLTAVSTAAALTGLTLTVGMAAVVLFEAGVLAGLVK